MDPGRVPRDLYPFEDRFLEIDGCRVHYVEEGSGPPLLLLHGNPTRSFVYRDLISGLRDRFRCIAVDHPGFGLSTAPASYGFTPAEHARILERSVVELDLRDVTMMAQDWGGPIDFAVATRHPDRFSAFVVGNTWAWPKADPGTWVFSGLLGSGLGRRLITGRNLFVERILPAGVRSGKLPAEVMDAYRGPFPTPASRLPTWPTRDIAFGRRERRRWEEVFPDHRTVMLDGAGHYIQEDAGPEILAAVGDWAGTLTAAR